MIPDWKKKVRALELVCRNMMRRGPPQWQRLTPSNTSCSPMCQQTTQAEEKCSCREAFQRSSAAVPPMLERSQTEAGFWGYCFLPCRGFLFRASIVWKATAQNDPRVSGEDATPLVPKQPQTELWDFAFSDTLSFFFPFVSACNVQTSLIPTGLIVETNKKTNYTPPLCKSLIHYQRTSLRRKKKTKKLLLLLRKVPLRTAPHQTSSGSWRDFITVLAHLFAVTPNTHLFLWKQIKAKYI